MGKRRIVLMEDLSLFGCKFIHEDHLFYERRTSSEA